MITFIDFEIKVTKPFRLFNNPEFENIEDTMLRMNAWIEENEIAVLNIETLFIPNLDSAVSEVPSEDSYYVISSLNENASKCYQIFRVWYHNKPKSTRDTTTL